MMKEAITIIMYKTRDSLRCSSETLCLDSVPRKVRVFGNHSLIPPPRKPAPMLYTRMSSDQKGKWAEKDKENRKDSFHIFITAHSTKTKKNNNGYCTLVFVLTAFLLHVLH